MEKDMAKTIHYANGQSSLGPLVVAISDRGVAMLEFGVMNEARLQALRAKFPDARIVEDRAAFGETLSLAAELVDHPESSADLALDLQGSDFELRVWNALRAIPAGTTTSYGEIAARLGSPREAREVAEACASNILAIAVPCHRVVKKDGSISGYRWGVARKRTLLAREGSAGHLQGSAERPHDLLSR
jgi:AraC family transcriptional regulator of adaptative response/methylated-DNA-[protein]-cysteine methyltransferase